jgi:amidase
MVTRVTPWIVRFERAGAPDDRRPRVAVKDAIDLAGVPTTAGCVAVRDRAKPAPGDAACLAGFRTAGVSIVGKTTLTELCLSPTGVNEAFGMPVNPLAPDLIPGGSSSGSAVVTASGEADIALGTDTGGSVRIPAACCGLVGLKTTWGRIPLRGVWPLAPTLDTVGPLARDMAGVVDGLRLLDPSWPGPTQPAATVGRLRIEGTDPAVEDAVDAALAAAGFTVHSVSVAGWAASFAPFSLILLGELWRCHHDLVDSSGLSRWVNKALHRGRMVSDGQLTDALAARAAWQAELAAALRATPVLALPTLPGPPPAREASRGFPITSLTAPFNLAGAPAIALPVPSAGSAVPPSLQLVGPMGGEDVLCATALVVEQAVAAAVAATGRRPAGRGAGGARRLPARGPA